jgi:hypothetical protein
MQFNFRNFSSTYERPVLNYLSHVAGNLTDKCYLNKLHAAELFFAQLVREKASVLRNPHFNYIVHSGVARYFAARGGSTTHPLPQLRPCVSTRANHWLSSPLRRVQSSPLHHMMKIYFDIILPTPPRSCKSPILVF